MTPKIATCCYCGTRAALVLKGKDRHELACSACGAPLHDLKMLKSDHKGRGGVVKPSYAHPKHEYKDRDWKRKKKKKPKKGLGRRMFEEAWDVFEDIFD